MHEYVRSLKRGDVVLLWVGSAPCVHTGDGNYLQRWPEGRAAIQKDHERLERWAGKDTMELTKEKC